AATRAAFPASISAAPAGAVAMRPSLEIAIGIPLFGVWFVSLARYERPPGPGVTRWWQCGWNLPAKRRPQRCRPRARAWAAIEAALVGPDSPPAAGGQAGRW